MLGAYYTKGFDSHELFDHLLISQFSSYHQHLNQHNVIYIDFSALPDPCDCYQEYIDWIKEQLRKDMENVKDTYIFILDEWDSIFYKKFMTENDKVAYLDFLKVLLKDQSYVELAYMTGVLPITTYSRRSQFHMFQEYNFMNDSVYESFFGFTEDEVRNLCEKHKSIRYDELQYWYDGYDLSDGKRLFNPRSVHCAFMDQVCLNYWTETGPMNEIAEYVEHNVDEVREDIVKLVSGIPVEIELQGYSAGELQLDTRDEILSIMAVFGFLSYHDGSKRNRKAVKRNAGSNACRK